MCIDLTSNRFDWSENFIKEYISTCYLHLLKRVNKEDIYDPETISGLKEGMSLDNLKSRYTFPIEDKLMTHHNIEIQDKDRIVKNILVIRPIKHLEYKYENGKK